MVTKGSTLHRVKNTRNFHIIVLFFPENVTFTWPAGVQHVLFFTIAVDKFAIYVPIGRYGEINTLQ